MLEIHVCVVCCCKENGGLNIRDEFLRLAKQMGFQEEVKIVEAECLGTCKYRPSVMVTDGEKKYYYGMMNTDVVKDILKYHLGLIKDTKTFENNLVKVETDK
jgi:(2Fe-2S) ferredoxin